MTEDADDSDVKIARESARVLDLKFLRKAAVRKFDAKTRRNVRPARVTPGDERKWWTPIVQPVGRDFDFWYMLAATESPYKLDEKSRLLSRRDVVPNELMLAKIPISRKIKWTFGNIAIATALLTTTVPADKTCPLDLKAVTAELEPIADLFLTISCYTEMGMTMPENFEDLVKFNGFREIGAFFNEVIHRIATVACSPKIKSQYTNRNVTQMIVFHELINGIEEFVAKRILFYDIPEDLKKLVPVWRETQRNFIKMWADDGNEDTAMAAYNFKALSIIFADLRVRKEEGIAYIKERVDHFFFNDTEEAPFFDMEPYCAERDTGEGEDDEVIFVEERPGRH